LPRPYARQTLASYAFFEEARRRGQPLQYALLPLILPFIAGKAGSHFSPDSLSREMQQLFGGGFNSYAAESLAPTLERTGYIKREADGASGAVFLYTDKVNDLTVESSALRGEEDVDEIIDVFRDFLDVTKPLVRFSKSNDEWRSLFVQWATSVDTNKVNLESWIDGLIASERRESLKLTENKEPEERFADIDRHIVVLFASFVKFLSRERRDLFDRVCVLVEIGLIIDLISDLRAPMGGPPKNITLTVVLDGPVLLDAVGLSGEGRRLAASTLIKFCRDNSIKVITLQHCVAEAKEIVSATLATESSWRGGDFADALRGDPRMEAQARKFASSTDQELKKRNIEILSASQIGSFNAKAAFDDSLEREFAAKLPYQDVNITQRRLRDAKSIAFVMRRRNGRLTSDLFVAGYALVTRSPVLANFASRFVKRKIDDYPDYAVAPAVELRHFSTLFMLAFGSGLGAPVSRGELLSSCERVLRTSPDMVRKVRDTMHQLELFSPEELEALMNDPVAIHEITAVTAGDPAVVGAENAAALALAIRNAAAKEAELRRRASEKELAARHDHEMKAVREVALSSQREAELATQALSEHMQIIESNKSELNMLIESIYDDCQARAKTYWQMLAVVFTIISAVALLELFADASNFPLAVRVVILVCVVGVAAYSWASRVFEGFSLFRLKERVLEVVVVRRASKMTSQAGRDLLLELLEKK